jgi:hypothetical protein
MTTKESFWMACDSIEQLRAEYGPFQTRAEAEAEARKLGFGFLLRYEHVIDANENIQEVRCIFIEHIRHRVRLFEQSRREGLKEIGDWRDQCA